MYGCKAECNGKRTADARFVMRGARLYEDERSRVVYIWRRNCVGECGLGMCGNEVKVSVQKCGKVYTCVNLSWEIATPWEMRDLINGIMSTRYVIPKTVLICGVCLRCIQHVEAESAAKQDQ